MARSARSAYVTPSETAVFYIRCRTKKSLIPAKNPRGSTLDTHRVQYIEDLIRLYAAHFGIAVHAHAVIRHEIRLVLQSRPEVIQALDDTQIAMRWLSICPTLRRGRTQAPEPTEKEIADFCSDPSRISQTRRRLSDISWLMRLLQQRVAQLCNREDRTEGSVWNGRFRAVLLLDATAHFTALANVDLAAVRVRMGKPVSASVFTSALHRQNDWLKSTCLASVIRPAAETHDSHGTGDSPANVSTGISASHPCCNHLAPIGNTEEVPFAAGRESSTAPRFRCSDQPAVSINLPDYQKLLRLTRDGFLSEQAMVSQEISSLLSILKLSPEAWLALVGDFDDLFSHVAGQPATMDAYVPKKGHHRAYVRPAARAIFRKCTTGHPVMQIPPAT
ncbi:MAG: hypothetical protein ACKO2P_07870 [Planctomycetota bacterium]